MLSILNKVVYMPGKVIIADDNSRTRKTYANGVSSVFGVQVD